jgi:uncharacterized protein (DUF1015 family)
MAEVQPLHPLHYAQEKVADLSKIITPPFDIIPPADQQHYYERHPYNIIRLELGQSLPSDDQINNVYTRAAATFADWRRQGIIQQTPQPCYYLYQQHFTHTGQHYTRTSILARVRLEPWEAKIVLPHEHTRKKDKEDRLNLLRACSTNFSPIMCMYDDPQGYMRHLLTPYADQANIKIYDDAGEEHRLQAITDPSQIALIQDFFSPRQLYIADGHHRYTTALQYRDEILAQRRPVHAMDGINFALMALIDVDDPGWLVLPTHRILFNLQPTQLAKLHPDALSRYFTVQRLPSPLSTEAITQQLAQTQHQPACLLTTANETLLLHMHEHGHARMAQSQHSPAWNNLDVSMVEFLLLNDILTISNEDIAAGTSIRYAHECQTALQALHSGNAHAVIFLNSLSLRQVTAVAQADDRMPPKSTYLYPKLVTGLVMNPLW